MILHLLIRRNHQPLQERIYWIPVDSPWSSLLYSSEESYASIALHVGRTRYPFGAKCYRRWHRHLLSTSWEHTLLLSLLFLLELWLLDRLSRLLNPFSLLSLLNLFARSKFLRPSGCAFPFPIIIRGNVHFLLRWVLLQYQILISSQLWCEYFWASRRIWRWRLCRIQHL